MAKTFGQALMVAVAVALFIRFDVIEELRSMIDPHYAAYQQSLEVEQLSQEIGEELIAQLGSEPMFQREYDALVGELWRAQQLIEEGRLILDNRQSEQLLQRVRRARQRFLQAATVNRQVLARIREVLQHRMRIERPNGSISA
ncbi:hypothetical protein EPO05_01570 [Patescibacteria group bacterium]|nr:MAG: hypothetical protein EPO05_01570 [Patescibacteria group bacterium]